MGLAGLRGVRRQLVKGVVFSLSLFGWWLLAAPGATAEQPAVVPHLLEREVLASSGVGFSTGAGPETPWGGGSLSDVDLVRYLDLVDSVGATGVRLDAYSPTDTRLERWWPDAPAERSRTCSPGDQRGRGISQPRSLRTAPAVALARKYGPLGVREYELGTNRTCSHSMVSVDPNGWRLRVNAAYDAIKAPDPRRRSSPGAGTAGNGVTCSPGA